MEKTRRGFVYIWYDRKSKRYYIGCHWGREDDGYICSSVWMRQSYKRRPHDFQKSDGRPNRKILARVYTNRIDLLKEEFRWLSLIKSEELGKRYYNLSKKHFGHWTTDENKKLSTLEKISIKVKESHSRPEVKEKLSASNKARFEKDPRKLVEAANKYYEENPGIRQERYKKMQAYFENNPDKKAEASKIFAKNLSDYYRNLRETGQKRPGRIWTDEQKKKISKTKRERKVTKEG